MIRLSHRVGDLITFFTGNDNEVRAWTVARGTEALKAAGKIHSDFERGFIRAEVVAFEDLAECGSLAEARGRGMRRVYLEPHMGISASTSESSALVASSRTKIGASLRNARASAMRCR